MFWASRFQINDSDRNPSKMLDTAELMNESTRLMLVFMKSRHNHPLAIDLEEDVQAPTT